LGEKFMEVDVGVAMLFANREKECLDMAGKFAEMRKFVLNNVKKRKNTPFDTVKKHIFVLLCEGIAGLGKSRIARVFMREVVTREHKGADAERYRRIEEAWPSIHQDVLDSVNLRIDCNCLVGEDSNACLLDCALELLFQWRKYDVKKEYMKKYRGDVALRSAFRRRAYQMPIARGADIFEEVLSLMYQSGRTFFVNFDEAQKCSTLRDILSDYAHQVFPTECRIFVTVTGLQGHSLSTVVEDSDCVSHSILLPPLSHQHMEEIVQDMFGPLEIKPSLQYLLRGLSGIARYLEYALVAIVKKNRCKRSHVINALKAFERRDANEIFETIVSAMGNGAVDTKMDVGVVNNMVAFAVTGVKVSNLLHLDTNLNEDRKGAKWTFKDLQDLQLCYIDGKEEVSPVVVPVLKISQYLRDYTFMSNCRGPQNPPLYLPLKHRG
jgi:hypothetical protein